MKKGNIFIRYGSIICRIGLILFILQNFYFGWNKVPMSKIEETVDYINKIIFYLGIIIYLTPLLSVYKKAVKNLNN